MEFTHSGQKANVGQPRVLTSDVLLRRIRPQAKEAAQKGHPDVNTTHALAEEMIHSGFSSVTEPLWVKPLSESNKVPCGSQSRYTPRETNDRRKLRARRAGLAAPTIHKLRANLLHAQPRPYSPRAPHMLFDFSKAVRQG